MHTLDPSELLIHYPTHAGKDVTRMEGGLINDTFAVGADAVLQRLHKIFAPSVNLDIAALAPALSAAGVPVPALIPTRDGGLYVTVERGELAGTWRLMTRLPGRTLHQVTTLAVAREAGAALAGFHAALCGVEHEFHFSRPGAHDTDAHMAKLGRTVGDWRGRGHRLLAEVEPLAGALAGAWSALGGEAAGLPLRIVHGDPKISNLLFDGPDEAPTVTGILDLDTMAWATLEVELGDAMRSWCSVATESATSASFDLARFEAAAAGYLSRARPWIEEVEWASLARGTERICLELAARFAVDALEESYFGWDPAVAPARGEHNLLRARNQWALAGSVAAARGAAEAVLERLWRAAPTR